MCEQRDSFERREAWHGHPVCENAHLEHCDVCWTDISATNVLCGLQVSGPFQDQGPDNGVWESKSYLRDVGFGSKPGIGCNGCSSKPATEVALPKLSGHVLVCGIGDVAIDCATSAFRCGADRVTLAFRKVRMHAVGRMESWEKARCCPLSTRPR